MSLRTINDSILRGFGNFAMRVEQNRTILTITEGLVNLIPLVLIGSICLVISNLPIPAFHVFLDEVTAGHWSFIAYVITYATENIIGLAALLSVSLAFATRSPFMQKHKVSVFIPMITAFACYVVLYVWDPFVNAATTDGGHSVALFTNPGRNGVLTALFVAVVAVRLFVAFSKLWQKESEHLWRIIGGHHFVRVTTRSVFPMALTLACFVLLRMLLGWIITSTPLVENLSTMVTNCVLEGTLPSTILSVLMMQVLWFFGAHGSQTIQSFMPSTDIASAASAAGSGGDLTWMFSNPDFYSVFIDIGGTGASFALLIALTVFGTAGKGKQLAHISAFPAVFNINETLLFGMPMILSPFFVLPFVGAPIILAIVAYGAFSLGLVPPMIHSVEWTMPMLLSGYLSTGSLAGAALQFVSVGLGFLVYAPFVLLTKRTHERYQLKIFDQFIEEASCAANNEQSALINRRDSIGEITRVFAAELTTCFDKDHPPFYLVYQPKTTKDARVVGAEALLRWTHPRFGPIPPDVLIEIADEAHLTIPLGRWVTTQALEELARWQQDGIEDIVLSINLNPHHLFIDGTFSEFVESELNRLPVDPSRVELEITEHVVVHASTTLLERLKKLRSLGIGLSVDDMGMGYSSLTYISDFGADVVKIDISLIDKITEDIQQQEIVRSVIVLAQHLDLTVVVEGVETHEQVEALTQLGCRYFQGFYYSRPLEPREFLQYVAQQGTEQLAHEGRGEDKSGSS